MPFAGPAVKWTLRLSLVLLVLATFAIGCSKKSTPIASSGTVSSTATPAEGVSPSTTVTQESSPTQDAATTKPPAIQESEQKSQTPISNSADSRTSTAKLDDPTRTDAVPSPKDSNDHAPEDVAAAGEGKPTATSDENVEEKAAAAEDARFGRERILLLVPDGPLLVELRLSIDGRRHDAALAEVIENVMKQIDAEGDGQATWEAVVSSPRFRYGNAGNLEAKDAGERQRMIKLYDSNRNGLVDRSELPRFVTRNAGQSRSFYLSASNLYHGLNRSQSPIRRWLDVDGDGILGQAELDTAAVRLLSRDADDDDVLVMAEFKVVVDNMEGQLPNRRRTSEGDTAFALGFQTKWPLVHYALKELYASGSSLEAEHFRSTAPTFTFLDENKDGALDNEEIQRLEVAPPDLVLTATFGEGFHTAEKALALSVAQPSLEKMIERSTNHGRRLSLQLPSAKIEFFVNDLASSDATNAQVDSLFARYDGDSNGYLDEKEYPAQELPTAPTVDAVDSNADQKVYADELKAYLQQRAAPARSQIRARAADVEDAFFAVLDEDGDGRLNSREISTAGARLRRYDRDGDGELRSLDIPECLVVGLARGDAQLEASLFIPPAVPPRPTAESLPKWFIAMDTNRDNEVSANEFLGDLEKFRQLDRNQDGFLAETEISDPTPASGGL